MADPSPAAPLVIGAGLDATRRLAGALGAGLTELPPPDVPDASEPLRWTWTDRLQAWRDAQALAPAAERVVVCTWEPVVERTLLDTDPAEWAAGVEQPLARWFAALAVAGQRCRDGGAVVVVVERPAPLDAAGQSAATAVAEGLIALTRSLAMIHGERGVRANVVTSQLATVPAVLHGLAPPLAGFPGTPEVEIAGAVRLLLSPDAAGVTGTVVRADSGRAFS